MARAGFAQGTSVPEEFPTSSSSSAVERQVQAVEVVTGSIVDDEQVAEMHKIKR